MVIINTFNIFEAAYYLTDIDSRVVDIHLTTGGFVNYSLSCSNKAKKMRKKFAGGIAYVHLYNYLWKYKYLYKLSIKLENEHQS